MDVKLQLISAQLIVPTIKFLGKFCIRTSVLVGLELISFLVGYN